MKTRIEELAILGGKPLFAEPLHVGRPNLPDKQLFFKLAEEIWESDWLTNNGPKVIQLEEALSQFLGVKHVIAVCNATIGLQIAIRALGMHGEVIVPSFTFVATAHSLEWQGMTPVFCDIDPETHCMDPARIEQLITPRTTGIIPVHLWGNVCDVKAIRDIADRHGLKVLYDAAHAFGCAHADQRVGGFGNAEVFSFHATKVLNTFEGGCIATNDDEVARIVRLMINFGFTGKDQVSHIGSNGKMSEMSAAMGLASLGSYEDFVAHNRDNHEQYRAQIEKIPGLRVISNVSEDARNYHYVVVEVSELAGIGRDLLVKVLEHENVLARRYFYPGCHRMEPYKSYYPNAGLLLPVTERLVRNLVCLPNGRATSMFDVERVSQLLDFTVAHGSAIEKTHKVNEK